LKTYLAAGASVTGVIFLFGMMANAVFGTYRIAPNYERVRIVEKTTAANGALTLTVRLSGKTELPVTLDRDAELHPDAQYICAGIYGDPQSRNARAVFAEISNCPLPVSRTLPRSGKVRTLTGSGEKTYRSMSGDTFKGSTSEFPRKSISIAR